jgi:hypothetical protein
MQGQFGQVRDDVGVMAAIAVSLSVGVGLRAVEGVFGVLQR